MTIRKGEAWGTEVERPPDLHIARDDAELAQRLDADPSFPVAVSAGDMFRTLGGRPLGQRSVLQRLPIDLIDVSVDGGERHVGVSHLIARPQHRRGGWWRGGILVVMNAEFVGEFDVAPRGHPNDGRVEVLDVAASLTARARLAVRRRLRTGTHLPHPSIGTRSVRDGAWTFESPRIVLVDGQSIGVASRVEVMVRPDAAHVYA